MRKTILALLCCAAAAAQTTAPKGQILRPSGDATLTNIAVGSAVTTVGTFGYTAEVYLVKGDGSAAPRRLTSFDESNQAPGATSVAISPDGSRAAYTGRLDTNGVRQEQVHTIDVATGDDRLIATAQSTCGTPPCLGPVTFSQDGTKLLWGVAGSAGTYNGSIYAANFDGSGLLQLGLQQAYISGPNNVTTTAGRFIFLSYDCGAFCDRAETAKLDGSGAAVIQTASNTVNGNFGDLVISASGAVTAEITQGYTPSHVTPIVAPALSQGQCRQGQVYYGSMGSMALSSDGTHAAGISAGQIFSCEGDMTPLNELYAFDVQLSSDGSRMIFSVGSNSVGRAAVWIADASGASSRPIFAPRSLDADGIVGLGSYPSDILPLSPGSYFTIYGNNFVDVDTLATAAELPFPQSLAGAKVQVNGTGVAIQAVTPWQINALLPQETLAGNVTVSVQLSDGTTLSQTATVQPTAPAVDLYAIPGLLDLQTAAFHSGTNVPADFLHPAVAGEILATYGFGLGVTTPLVDAGIGAPSNPPASAAMPFVNIDGVLARTTFAGLVPGFAGLYQVNVVVPGGLPPGKHLMHWYSLDPTAGPQGTIYTQ